MSEPTNHTQQDPDQPTDEEQRRYETLARTFRELLLAEDPSAFQEKVVGLFNSGEMSLSEVTVYCGELCGYAKAMRQIADTIGPDNLEEMGSFKSLLSELPSVEMIDGALSWLMELNFSMEETIRAQGGQLMTMEEFAERHASGESIDTQPADLRGS